MTIQTFFAKLGAAALAAFLLFGAGFLAAKQRYDAAEKIEKMTAKAATLEADLKIARAAETEASKSADELKQAKIDNESLIHDLFEDLSKRPPACLLDAADAERLRDID